MQQGQTVEDGVAGKRKADTDGDGVASESAKKAKEADGEPYNSLSGLIHEDEEKKAMQRLNSLRKCTFKCTDVPFLQYDKDGPRRTGPLVQYVQTLLSRHPGDVVYMDNLAIDLLSLACEQVPALSSLSNGADCASSFICIRCLLCERCWHVIHVMHGVCEHTS